MDRLLEEIEMAYKIHSYVDLEFLKAACSEKNCLAG